MRLPIRSFAVMTLAALLAISAGCGKDSTSPTPGDTTAPTVSYTNPPHGATGVAVITATFSESMTPSTLSTATFLLTGPGPTAVPGTVNYNESNHTASFMPSVALAASTPYTATITVGAKDVSGNALASNTVWTFTTFAAPSNHLAPVLGLAATYVILAGSTVTSTGPTVLGGDLGVSPGTAVTGFPPGTLTGATHAGNATSAAAMAHLTVAYNNLVGRTQPVIVAGNLGGLTLPPGLYKSTSSLAISSGDLTLDAQGDPNAVFIFQMASTLTTTSGRAVILAGGAKAANVFWQVGSSATFGTTSNIKGTVIADQSISLNTAATLNGRALARIGAVTLASNSAILPTP